jgi:hypothetical protein
MRRVGFERGLVSVEGCRGREGGRFGVRREGREGYFMVEKRTKGRV